MDIDLNELLAGESPEEIIIVDVSDDKQWLETAKGNFISVKHLDNVKTKEFVNIDKATISVVDDKEIRLLTIPDADGDPVIYFTDKPETNNKVSKFASREAQ